MTFYLGIFTKTEHHAFHRLIYHLMGEVCERDSVNRFYFEPSIARKQPSD